jgi:ElaB/YqjD/DUF883 family membrane-anchored ribosome-binding protein
MSELTSKDYARDAEMARRRLNDKLTGLQDGLTPGRLLDEVMSYGKNGGTVFLKALNNAARENPLPTMLVSAGCAMFLAEKSGLMRAVAGSAQETKQPFRKIRATADEHDGSERDDGPGIGQRMREGAHDAADAIGDKAAQVGGMVSGIGQRMKEGAQDAADAVSDKVGEMASGVGQSVKGAVTEAGDQVVDLADRTKEQATSAARQLKDRADAFMHEQPLLAAAIGVAIGAVVAAVFPATELEDEMMGETSDAAKEAVEDIAAEQLEAVKEVASEVVDEAKKAADQEGLTPAAVGDSVRNLGNRVGRVVEDVAETAATEVRERMRPSEN